MLLYKREVYECYVEMVYYVWFSCIKNAVDAEDVAYLYDYKGYSVAEVAEILKKPQPTICGNMREARILLKGVLEDEEL